MTQYPRRRAGIVFVVSACLRASIVGFPSLVLAPVLLAQSPISTELRVNVLRELGFGYASAGAPVSGMARDTGVFEIVGPPGNEVDVVFALPNELESAAGSRLALDFDATSGGYSAAQTGADRQAFDPRLRQRFRIPPSGRFLLYLAAHSVPPRAQSPGHYRASVVVFVSQTP